MLYHSVMIECFILPCQAVPLKWQFLIEFDKVNKILQLVSIYLFCK